MAEINEINVGDSLLETLKRTAKGIPEKRRSSIEWLKKANENTEDYCTKKGVEIVEGALGKHEENVIFLRNNKKDE